MTLTLIKIGGSLITDKTQRASFREATMQRIAAEIAAARQAMPSLALLLGHGSGSFGHFEAKHYGTMSGVATPEQWIGFARVASVAAELNRLVAQCFLALDVPVLRLPPSALAQANQGNITAFYTSSIHAALNHGLVPLLYGDVAFDSQRGGTIVSTETVFAGILPHLPLATRILLLGEVDGVLDAEGLVIPQITSANYAAIKAALGGSSGVDVTGGMETKVSDMLLLAQSYPRLEIRILNGSQAGLLHDTLLGIQHPGTRISAE